MATNIHHKYFFAQPPEQVWEYLTKAELMALWLMPNDFLPILGHEFTFRIKAIPAREFDGIIYCKVLEMAPFKKLSYSWALGPGDGRITMDSTVVWQLLPKENGTELILDHTSIKEVENIALWNGMRIGWLENMQKMDVKINASIHGTTTT